MIDKSPTSTSSHNASDLSLTSPRNNLIALLDIPEDLKGVDRMV
jgi:hypothetical protein